MRAVLPTTVSLSVLLLHAVDLVFECGGLIGAGGRPSSCSCCNSCEPCCKTLASWVMR